MTIFQEVNGYSIVDKDGMEAHRGLDASTARSMVDFYLENDRDFGCTLRIVPSKPIPPAPPIVFDLRPHWAVAPPPKLPDVEPGEEREHLRQCIARRVEASEALQAAIAAAERGQVHLSECESEVVRLRAADVAETAAAGAALAARLTDGASAPLEPNLRTGRNALLDAEARRDAAKEAVALLDAGVADAKQALATAEQAAQLAADVVLRAELRQRVDQLNALWAQITPLRQLIDDALNCGTPIDVVPAREAFNVPDLKFTGDAANKLRLHNYRRALQQNADATFEDQSAEVTQ
jgi:hypothetical protein